MNEASHPAQRSGGRLTALACVVASAFAAAERLSAASSDWVWASTPRAAGRTTAGTSSAAQTSHCSPSLLSGIQLTCSEEIDSRAPDPPAAVARLDDAWRAAVDPATIEVGRIEDRALPIVLGTSDGVIVTAELYDIVPDDLLDVRCDAVGRLAATQGYADDRSGVGMQEAAPRPTCLGTAAEAFWNEQAGGSASRNAVLFRFSQPVRAFGAWFGDLETRNDGFGRAAVVRLLGANGACLGDAEVATSAGDAATCGDHSNTSGIGCGNRATRWIGFVSPAPEPAVSAMLVVVGDDDRHAPNDGFREHISFIGPSVGRLRPTPSPEPRPDPALPAAEDLPVRVYVPWVVRASAQGPRLAAGACP